MTILHNLLLLKQLKIALDEPNLSSSLDPTKMRRLNLVLSLHHRRCSLAISASSTTINLLKIQKRLTDLKETTPMLRWTPQDHTSSLVKSEKQNVISDRKLLAFLD